jgi:hypothetical protein
MLLVFPIYLGRESSWVALGRLTKYSHHLFLHLFFLSLLAYLLILKCGVVEGRSCHSSSSHPRSLHLGSSSAFDLILSLPLHSLSCSFWTEHTSAFVVARRIISIIEILLWRLHHKRCGITSNRVIPGNQGADHLVFSSKQFFHVSGLLATTLFVIFFNMLRQFLDGLRNCAFLTFVGTQSLGLSNTLLRTRIITISSLKVAFGTWVLMPGVIKFGVSILIYDWLWVIHKVWGIILHF